jgi:hypothetical protein
MHSKCWSENLKRGDHLEDTGVDGKKMLTSIKETGLDGVDWIHLAQDRDQWRVLVDTVMKLRVP